MGHEECAGEGESAVAELEDGDGSGLGCNIEAPEAGVEGEDVGVVSGDVGGKHGVGTEIEERERVVGFSGDEGEVRGGIERDAVRVGDAGERIASDDFERGGIDDGELVEVMDGDEDASCGWVVDGVACSAAERDVGNELVGGGVDDGVFCAVLVGDEDAALGGGVGDAVGIGDGASGGDGLEGGHVDDGELVQAGGGGVDAMDGGDGEDSVNTAEAGEIGEDTTGAGIEDDEVAGAHVGDVETVVGSVVALIVEADGGAGHGDVGDLDERCGRARGLREERGGKQKGGEERDEGAIGMETHRESFGNVWDCIPRAGGPALSIIFAACRK